MYKEIEKAQEINALVGETEGARRATGVSPTRAAEPMDHIPRTNRPDPEVPEKPARRRFTAEYKLKILKEADACFEYGERGALLRREALYSSHLNNWRKQRDKGSLDALKPSKRGRKTTPKNPLADQVASLERQNRKLQKRLDHAELIIDIQKKVASFLGINMKQPPSEEDE
jgi:transposase-like protein